jgi:hypothetical protein
MQSKTSMLIKMLINRFHPDENDSLLKYLPEEEAKAVQQQNITYTDPNPLFSLSKDIIARMHYSWMVPSFQKLPAWKQQILASALPPEQGVGLKRILKIGGRKDKPTPALKTFLTDKLLEVWHPNKDVMPLAFLPASPLSPLLNLSKSKLVELIDLFAMHDLAESIRHIVDKNRLKTIYNCLSPTKQQFLRMCLHQKEKVTASKLEITKWDGDKKKLEQILHKRGLLRLGKALCGQHPQFFWYIMHTLDTGRGETLSRYYKEDPIPEISPLLVQQVLSLINFIKQKDDS